MRNISVRDWLEFGAVAMISSRGAKTPGIKVQRTHLTALLLVLVLLFVLPLFWFVFQAFWVLLLLVVADQ